MRFSWLNLQKQSQCMEINNYHSIQLCTPWNKVVFSNSLILIWCEHLLFTVVLDSFERKAVCQRTHYFGKHEKTCLHVFSHGLTGLWNLKTLDNSLTGSMWCKLTWLIYITASTYGLSHQGQWSVNKQSLQPWT